jgi:hypothetical protein
MKKQAEDSFVGRCQFKVSLRYDLFYSLNALLDPASRIHPAWRKASLKALGKDFEKLISEIGHSWELWPVLAAIFPGPLSNPSFEELLKGIQALPISIFKEKIMRGLIHSEAAVALILKKQASLRVAVSKVPKTKREWISHIGLFPYDPESPQVIALEKLIADPVRFLQIIIRVLEVYWQKSFRSTWERLQPQLRRSIEERERLFHSISFAEFSKQALLRIGIDEKRGTIQAIRGGYRLRFEDIEACYFLPSAFNDRRFWSAFSDDDAAQKKRLPFTFLTSIPRSLWIFR